MRTRLVGGAMALGIAVGLVGAAVVAATDGGGNEPRRLAVLGSAGAGAGTEAAMTADSSVAFGGTTYRLAPGVDHPGGEATAWSVGMGDAIEERIAELATALGLSGDVVSEELAWSVTDGDRRLEVQRQPGLPWALLSMSAMGLDGSGSPSAGAVASPDDAVSSDGGVTGEGEAMTCAMPECPPGSACTAVCPEVDPLGPCDDPAAQCLAPDDLPEPERPADLPSAAEAEALARELLATAGLDLDGAAVRVDDGFTSWYVAADPSVDGVPTVGMSWGAAVGAGGAIESANGWLTEPARGDSYPLLPVATAVERLSGMALTLVFPVECPAGETCPEPEPVVLTVTAARLALQLVSSFEAEEAFLVPSYLFEIDGGGPTGELAAFAVADEYLATPPTDEPVPLPEPLPGGTTPGAEEPLPAEGPGAEEPPDVGPGEAPPEEPVDVPVDVPRDGQCSVATGPAGQAAPLEVEVCAVNGTAGVAPVVLTVRGTDPDARVRDDCGSPVVDWGDGERGAVCDIGVACAPGETPVPLDTSMEHLYAEPGRYAVTVTVESVCDDPASGSLTVPVTAMVEP